MKGRRAFLKEASALTLLSSFSRPALCSEASAITPAQAPTPAKSREPLGWKPHPIKRGDGRGGWTVYSGEYQFLVHQESRRESLPLRPGPNGQWRNNVGSRLERRERERI